MSVAGAIITSDGAAMVAMAVTGWAVDDFGIVTEGALSVRGEGGHLQIAIVLQCDRRQRRGIVRTEVATLIPNLWQRVHPVPVRVPGSLWAWASQAVGAARKGLLSPLVSEGNGTDEGRGS